MIIVVPVFFLLVVSWFVVFAALRVADGGGIGGSIRYISISTAAMRVRPRGVRRSSPLYVSASPPRSCCKEPAAAGHEVGGDARLRKCVDQSLA